MGAEVQALVRRTAGSIMSGRLVAAMQKTDFLAPTPSISVRIWLTIRSPASPPPWLEPRFLAIESISSKKRMHGAAPRACKRGGKPRNGRAAGCSGEPDDNGRAGPTRARGGGRGGAPY